MIEEVGDKKTEVFLHYGSCISVVVETEYSKVGCDMMMVRLNLLIGCPLEDICT